MQAKYKMQKARLNGHFVSFTHSFSNTNPVIVALDVSFDEACRLVDSLRDQAGAFKIGAALYTEAGAKIIKHIHKQGASVFLDLKFHDIPNTVANAVMSAVRLDVEMLSIHTHGGFDMMHRAIQSAQETASSLGKNPPLLLGVSVLTSLDRNDLRKIGIDRSVSRQVEKVVKLGLKAGLRGFVCSPLEIAKLRRFVPPETQLVVPAIRILSSQKDCQKRMGSPEEALRLGANRIVIGRPIYKSPHPRETLRTILQSIASAKIDNESNPHREAASI